MDIDVFRISDRETVFRALRSALRPAGMLASVERRFLKTYAHIVGYRLPASDPSPLSPHEVQIQGVHQRKRLVQLTAIAALLDRPVKPASVAFVTGLAQHLGVREPVVAVLQALAQGRRLKVRML